MKENDNPRISKWANESNVTFLVGDSSRDILNMDLSNRVPLDSDYKEQNNEILRNYLHNLEKKRAGCAVMFYSIHYLFDNIDSIRTLFKNVSNVVGKNGFFLVTTPRW